MTLVAHIIPANGGHKVEKQLAKGLGKLAIGAGDKIEIVDTVTGAPVQAYSVKAHGKGLLLKFAMPEGEVALELSGDISAFAALASDEAAVADAAADEAADQPNGDAQTQGGADERAGAGGSGGLSPILLGVLGLGALGGIAAAVSGGGSKKSEPADKTPPAAPGTLDLAAADDSGSSDSDNITRNTSALTITGTAEAGARIELFNGATSLGAGTANASGQFSIDIALAQGTHSITAKATDAAGNAGPVSAALSIVVDTTGPTAMIALDKSALIDGDSATVTVSFSEAVAGFALADLTAPSGTLSNLLSSNGGRTWTATFTPSSDVSDTTNVISLATSYTDIAGNSGATATSANYSVETLTFTVVPGVDGSVNFGGTATGPITLTLNAQDEAIFSRGGKAADTVIDTISSKTMNIPQGGQLNVAIDGETSSDTFTLDAPNASKLVFTGNGGGLSDTLTLIIQSATGNPDLRTLTIDTSGLTGVESIRFVFPDDASDVVRLTADSDLSGFSTIEVSKGGLDLSAVTVQPGVEFIVNSTLYLTLAQFKTMSAVLSVTGMGNLVINLTEDEVESGALDLFLNSNDSKPILIGTTVAVRDPDGDPVDVPPALDAISYPGIPELSDRVNEELALIRDDSMGEDGPSLDSIAGLRAAIEALLDGTGLGDPLVEGSLAYQLADLQSQIDDILEGIAGDATPPSITQLYLDSATGADSDGAYNAGDVLTYKVQFSEIVLVSGSPTLMLTMGDGEDENIVYAELIGGAGTDTLTFSYTVGSSDSDLTGIGLAANPLNLANGAITDVAGNPAVVTHAGLSDDDGPVINNEAKSLTLRATSIFGNGDDIDNLVVGVLVSDDLEVLEEVRLVDLDRDGDFDVPAGATFLSMAVYLRITDEDIDADEIERLLAGYSVSGGDTAKISIDDLRLTEYDTDLLMTEADFRLLVGDYDFTQSDFHEDGIHSIDDFIERGTFALAQIEMLFGTEFSGAFLEAIAGHDPADIRLDVSSPLTLAQAVALAAAGFDMAEMVDYSIRDYSTAIQGALSDPTLNIALQNADQVISRGDELDNHVEMAGYNWFGNLRTELGAGNDVFNSGRNLQLNAGTDENQIVGQHGGDTINLTSRDLGRDVVVYQTIHDGRTTDVVDLTFSTNSDHYQDGSRLSVIINGREYSYTTDDGASEGEEIAYALHNFGQKILETQVVGQVVIGLLYDTPLYGEELGEPSYAYQDEMRDGAYVVPAGKIFLPVTTYLGDLLANGEIDADILLNTGLTGGQSFRLTNEAYLAFDAWSYADDYEGALLQFEGETVLVNADVYKVLLDSYPALEEMTSQEAQEAMEAALRFTDVSNIRIDGESGTMTFIGGSTTRNMVISGGAYGDDEEAIVNLGQAVVQGVTFFGGEDGDYFPAGQHGEHNTEFAREMRIVINGKTITASIVEGDPAASVANLAAAIEAAMSETATNAITAAYVEIALGTALTPESEIESYDITLVINGREITVAREEAGTVADLIAAIKAVGGVQSVELDGESLVITSEVRGTSAAANTITVAQAQIDGVDLDSQPVVAEGGSLDGVVTDVTVVAGTTIEITGPPFMGDETDVALTIDTAEIDGTGTQQIVALNYSDVDADYYAGGTLSVTINGEIISADMTGPTDDEPTPFHSLSALADAINLVAGEDADLLIERAYIGQDDGDWKLYVVSSIEAPDALAISDIRQSYRGEEQTATITLEEALSYSAQLATGEDAGDRMSTVYFSGGQVHATFAPRVDDGEDGLMDGTSVTVSADMQAGTTSFAGVEGLNAQAYLSIEALTLTIGDQTYDEGDFDAYLVDLGVTMAAAGIEPNEVAQITHLIAWLEGLEGVASVTSEPSGAFTLTYKDGVAGAISAIEATLYIEDNSLLASEAELVTADFTDVSAAQATAQALADAINATTQDVYHFDLGEDVGRDMTLSDGAKFSLQLSVDGVVETVEYDGEDEQIATVGDLLDALNETFEGRGVWSISADGQGLDFTVPDGTEVEMESSLEMVLDGGTLTAETMTLDEATLPFIGNAVADGATVTITAAQVGKDSFTVSDARLDYSGVQQLATALFSDDGEDYYEGGTLSIEIDTTPGVDGGIVKIQANMVAGDAAASLQNLVDEINQSVDVDPTAATIVLNGLPDASGETTNEGSLADEGLYFSSWSLTVGTGEDAITYGGRGEVADDEGEDAWVELAGDSRFNDMAAFLAHLEALDGIASVSLDEGGNIVIITEATGPEAYVSLAFTLAADVTDDGAGTVVSSKSDYGSNGELDGILSHAILDDAGTITLVSADAVREQFSITDAALSVAAVYEQETAAYSVDDADYYEGGKIGMVVNETTIEVDMIDGDAAATVAALRDAIWAQNNNHIGIVDIDNEWDANTDVGAWSVGTGEGAVSSGEDDTLGALLTALEDYPGVTSAEIVNGKIVITGEESLSLAFSSVEMGAIEVDVGTDIYGAFSSVTVEDGTIFLTAATATDDDQIAVDKLYMTAPGRAQVTEIDFSDADLALGVRDANDDVAMVSLTIGDAVITTATQATRGETVRALAQAVIEARDGVYQEEIVTAQKEDFPAIVTIELPDAVDGETRLIKDETRDSALTFAVAFTQDGPTFTFAAPADYDWSIHEFVEELNAQILQWEVIEELDTGNSGTVSYNAETNQIVITSNAVGATAMVDLEGLSISSFYTMGTLQINDQDAGLSFSHSTPIQEEEGDLAETVIALPSGTDSGFTPTTVISGRVGNFPDGEAAIDIGIQFLVETDTYEFTVPTHLEEPMTVSEFMTYLTDQLEQYASQNNITDGLGSFAYDLAEGEITFTPADNYEIVSYEFTSFSISSFQDFTPLNDGDGPITIPAINELSTGGSDLLVMTNVAQDLSASDHLSLDPIAVEFVIGGVTYTGTFLPTLDGKPGAQMPTVGDFLAWMDTEFADVVAVEIVNGSIVFLADGLESGTVSLTLADVWQTVTTDAVGLTVPVNDAPGGVITLSEFAGMSGDTLLGGERIEFDLYTGTETEGSGDLFSYDVEEGATLADLVSAINEFAGGYVTVALTTEGLVLSATGEGGVDRLWITSLSVVIDQSRTGATEGLADILGNVEIDGDSLILHGANRGEDELEVSVSHDAVDTDESDRQVMTVDFNNKKLDEIVDGSVVSLTIKGVTTSIVVRTVADQASGDELDLAEVDGAARSKAILTELIDRVTEDHAEGTFFEIARGNYDEDNAFIEGDGNGAVVLRITAGRYGADALGTAATIRATIVDAEDAEQFSVISDEVQAGSATFVESGSSADIYDETGESDAARTGRGDVLFSEDSSGTISLQTLPDGTPEVVTGDAAEEYDLLEIYEAAEGEGPSSTDASLSNPTSSNGYYGEPGASGTNGVRQTHQNPSGSYAAVDGTPTSNAENISIGDDAQHGAASGYYDEDGLHTDHRDGDTLVDDEDHYDVGQTGSQTIEDGVYQGETGIDDSEDDGFLSEVVSEGVAGFTWDHVIKATIAKSNANADVINNFDVAHDVISFEGDAERLSSWGSIDHVSFGQSFDLDWEEFGLIGSEDSGLKAADIGNEHLVAELLGRAFDVYSSEYEDDYNDVSYFAITSEDDPSKTAIWAHRQSYGWDETIDANELNLLAIVNTIGGEFYADNLRMGSDEMIG